MRKLFWPCLALTVFFGARHVVMTAYLANRSIRLNLARAAKLTDPHDQDVYLKNVQNAIASYNKQLNFFRLIDREPNTTALLQLDAVVAQMRKDAKFSMDEQTVAQNITRFAEQNRSISVAVFDDQQKTTSMILFWVFAVLAGISGAMKTMAPPE